MAGKAGRFTTSRLAIPYPNKSRFTNDEERLFPNRDILRSLDDLDRLEDGILRSLRRFGFDQLKCPISPLSLTVS